MRTLSFNDTISQLNRKEKIAIAPFATYVHKEKAFGKAEVS